MFGAVLHPSHHPHHEANRHASRGVVDTSSWTAAEREALVALVGRLSDASSAKSNPQLAGPLHYAELLVMEPEAGKDSAMAATSGLSIIAALAMAASVTSALDPLSDDEHPTLAFWYNIFIVFSFACSSFTALYTTYFMMVLATTDTDDECHRALLHFTSLHFWGYSTFYSIFFMVVCVCLKFVMHYDVGANSYVVLGVCFVVWNAFHVHHFSLQATTFPVAAQYWTRHFCPFLLSQEVKDAGDQRGKALAKRITAKFKVEGFETHSVEETVGDKESGELGSLLSDALGGVSQNRRFAIQRALIAEGLTHDVLIDAARAGSSVLWKSLDYEPLNMSHGERVRLVTKLAHSSVAAVAIANAGGA